jgi:hypothetical protein
MARKALASAPVRWLAGIESLLCDPRSYEVTDAADAAGWPNASASSW